MEYLAGYELNLMVGKSKDSPKRGMEVAETSFAVRCKPIIPVSSLALCILRLAIHNATGHSNNA